MRNRGFALILAGILPLTGCGGKPTPPSDTGTDTKAPPKSGGSVEGLLGKDSQPAPPPPSVTEPSTAPASPPQSTPASPTGTYSPRVEEAAGQLTMFVQQFNMEYKRMPTSLNELVTPAGYLPYIFPPPKGKKWIIDAKEKQVKLADQ